MNRQRPSWEAWVILIVVCLLIALVITAVMWSGA